MLDEYNRPVRMKNGRLSVGQAEKQPQPVVSSSSSSSLSEGTGDGQEGDGVVIEITETLPEILGEQEEMEEEQEQAQGGESAGVQQGQEQKVLAVEAMRDEDGSSAAIAGEGSHEEVKQSTQQQQLEQPPSLPLEEGNKPQQPELAEGLVLNPNDETQKPVSRAERRRLIKEEIARLSAGNQPVYYQRRLW